MDGVEGERMTPLMACCQDSRLSFPRLAASAPEHSALLAIRTDILDRVSGRSQPSPSHHAEPPHLRSAELPRLFRSG